MESAAAAGAAAGAGAAAAAAKAAATAAASAEKEGAWEVGWHGRRSSQEMGHERALSSGGVSEVRGLGLCRRCMKWLVHCAGVAVMKWLVQALYEMACAGVV